MRSNGEETKLVRLLNRKGKGLNPALLPPAPDPAAEWRRMDEGGRRGRRARRRYCQATYETTKHGTKRHSVV